MNHFDGDKAPNDAFGNLVVYVVMGLLMVLLIPFLSVMWTIFALPFK